VLSRKPFTRDFVELTGITLGATVALYVLGTVIHILFHVSVG
jgi:hypothetical protein